MRRTGHTERAIDSPSETKPVTRLDMKMRQKREREREREREE